MAPTVRGRTAAVSRTRALWAASTVLLGMFAGALATDLVAPGYAQVPPTTGLAQGTAAPPPKAFPKQKGSIFGPSPKVDNAAPLYLQGDELIYDTRGNRVIARGNVEIYYNNYILTADQVIYDQSANKLLAEGNAQLKDPNGNITRADRLEATDDFRDAFVQSLSVVARDDSRFAAVRAIRRDGNVTEFERGKFTPCKSDGSSPPLWCISAARIVHDQQKALVTYQDARFELFGVPVLYLPYFQHADPSVKRQSGFLAPSFSTSSSLGFGVEVPYYFALAQNYDFTFNPTYYAKQGVLYQGTWRHRLENGQYLIKMAGIDQDIDDLPSGSNRKLDGWRGTLETRGLFSLSSWWRFGWDVTLESDESFRRFYKFDNILQTDRVNVGFIQGISDRNYFNASIYQFGGLLFDDTVTSRSVVHPVVDYNYIFNGPVLGGELSTNFHARALTRRDNQPRDGTDSSHVVAEVNWRRKLIDGIGQLWTPFASLRGDVYSFNDARDPNNLAIVQPNETVTRGNAVAGLQYAYPFVAHTQNASHTLTPIAQVIARPNRVDQRWLPDEDAKSLVWDDTLLFDIDKFSGYDRFETGTRVNYGAQYTFQANNGFNGRFVFGQSRQIAGENPYADPGKDVTAAPAAPGLTDPNNFTQFSGLETQRSDYVAGLYISPQQGLSLTAQGRFDERDLSLRRQDTVATLTAGPVLAQAIYTYSRADPALLIPEPQQELIGTLGLRLTTNWSVLGQLRYDLDASTRLQDVFQVKYSDECFVLTATYTETFINDPTRDIRPDRSLMLRFELKHLGEFNYKTDNLSNIFGHNQPFSAQ